MKNSYLPLLLIVPSLVSSAAFADSLKFGSNSIVHENDRYLMKIDARSVALPKLGTNAPYPIIWREMEFSVKDCSSMYECHSSGFIQVKERHAPGNYGVGMYQVDYRFDFAEKAEFNIEFTAADGQKIRTSQQFDEVTPTL